MSANPSILVADCERLQTTWFRTRSQVLNGPVLVDGPLTWYVDGVGAHLMFPAELPRDELARGVQWCRELGVRIGVWLSAGVDPAPLADAGFQEDWTPCWMAARIEDIRPAADPRVQLQEESRDYRGGDAAYARDLALTRQRPQHTWYAAAYDARSRFAGRVWAHADGTVAGIYDMAVWPRFQRQGFGTGLLRTVCEPVAAAGVTDVVLNATDQGRPLYERCGFEKIGDGCTWSMPGPPPGPLTRVRRGVPRVRRGARRMLPGA
jgi:GNAT superfamily N-acetyltransferase